MSHTIAAVSTGNQVAAIGILRLSGDDCIEIAEKVFSRPLQSVPDRKLILGELFDIQSRAIDQCMAVVSRAPHSYTGENTVEFHCHGSPAVLAAGLQSLYAAGARPARRGEFTKRAFLNGKLDLTQAEAVIDLIEAETADAAANAAGQVGGRLQKVLLPVYDRLTDLCSHFHAVLDYPDEDIEDFGLTNYAASLRSDAKALYALLQTYGQGRILRQGVKTAIVGRPNVGKSSLLNALAGFDRAIVTDIPGTTRDTVEETVLAGSTRLRLIDTAGIRQTAVLLIDQRKARVLFAIGGCNIARTIRRAVVDQHAFPIGHVLRKQGVQAPCQALLHLIDGDDNRNLRGSHGHALLLCRRHVVGMRVIAVGALIRQHTPDQRQAADLKVVLKRIELARLLKVKARIDVGTGRFDHQAQISLAARVEQ